MTPVIFLMGWCMASLCFLLIASEMADLVTSAYRFAVGASEVKMPVFGRFNLQRDESKLSERHDHTFRTSSVGMGGLNRFE